MSEKMNAGMEKIYFHWILDHAEQFQRVEPYFFKNDEIQFIYSAVREEYLISKNKVVPQPQQILAMVKLLDTEKKISDALIKTILKGDNSQYEEDWILPRFKAWKLSNQVKNNVLKSIEYVRGIEEINYDNVVDVSAKIKNLYAETMLIDNDEEDLGEDFDDPESHKIKTSNKKIPTGWSCLDKILGGGWDQSSLNCLMAETSGGKCETYDSLIKIRNIITGEIEEIKIGDFFKRIKG